VKIPKRSAESWLVAGTLLGLGVVTTITYVLWTTGRTNATPYIIAVVASLISCVIAAFLPALGQKKRKKQ